MRDENIVRELSYWQTILEQFMTNTDIPLQVRRKIELAQPSWWNDKTLYLIHPEAEWMNARIAKMATHLIQGLCPNGKVVFTRPDCENTR